MKLFSRLIVLLLFSSVFLFAGAASDSNYTTDFGIYVYGNIQSIENAFILVQAVATSSAMGYIIALLVAFHLPYSAYNYFKDGNGATLAANLTFMTISVLSLDVTHLGTTVHIEDLRVETNMAGLPAKTYAQVDDIPYPIALLTSTVSTVTNSIKDLYENAIQVVNVANGLDIKGMSYGNVGFANGLGDILKIAKRASFMEGDTNTTLFGRATQAYITDCALAQAVQQNPNLIQNIKNPKQDIFLAISAANLNITGNSYKINFDKGDGSGTQEYQCDNFYNNMIKNKYSDEADKLLARLDKATVGNLNNSDVSNGLISAGADVNSSLISSQLGKFQAYAMNVAATGPVTNAFRNYATNITSGQAVANSITAASSLATLQNEGAGKFKWMAEILPLGFHYMLGVIYTISILIMIIATALGYQKGAMIWKNFAKGLMTFEFIKVALVIINSSVNQYTAMHAADFLASVGQNPATVTSLPYSISYIATMTGIAGILGISAVFMIPAMVFSGEVGMAAGALSGLASTYKGHDIQTGIHESAQQKAHQEAWERDLQDQASLDHLGLAVPNGMGASEYYSEYKKSAESANAGFGAARMGTSAIDSAAHAVKGQTMQSIQAMSTLDSVSTMSDFVSAGAGTGAMMANKLGSDIGYGKTVSAESAKVYGELSGEAKGHADKGTYEGAVATGTDNYLKGMENQAAKKSGSTASYGKKTSLKEAIDAGRFEGLLSAGKDKTIAADPNLEGDATTLGNLSGDKTLQQAHGAQKAQIYNNDGSHGHEHSKFMLGAEELQRKGYNEKELAMGAAMANKSEKEKRQMMADVQASNAGKILDDFSHAGGSRKTLDVSHDKDGYIDGVSNENRISWEDTNGKTHHMSRAKANEMLADAGMIGMIGKGAGIYSQTQRGKNMGVVANNAMASEGANIAGLNSAIQTAGGVDGFVGLKSSSSAVQTAEAIGGTEGKVQEALMKNNPQMSKEQAEAMSKAIVEGSKEGAQHFKDALGTLGSLASTISAGKTASDLKSISVAGGKEGYVDLQTKTAQIRTDSQVGTTEGDIHKMNNDKVYQGIINKHLAGLTPGSEQYKKAVRELQEAKFLDASGHLNQNKDERFQGLMQATKGNMAGMHGITVGSSSYSVSGGAGGSNDDVRVSKDTSVTDKFGSSTQLLTQGKFKSQLDAFKVANGKGPRSMQELAKWVENSDLAEESKNSFFGNLVNTVATRLGVSPDSAEVGAYMTGIGLGGYMFNKGLGNPVGKAWDKVDNKLSGGKNAESSHQSSDNTQYDSTNHHNNEPDNSHGKQTAHSDLLNKDIPNSTTSRDNVKGFKGFSGENVTESGIILPDHPKEPMHFPEGHMSHMPEGRWGKALEGLSHMGKWGKGLSIAAAALTGVSLMGAENQVDVGETLDPFFSSSMGDSSTFKTISPSQNNSSHPVRTLEAVQNDPGMGPAIDAYNTNQNIKSFQNHQPGRSLSFNTRGGEMQMMKNSRTGMLRMHLPGQPFATDTNLPYGQFGNILNDPSKQEQFSQMLAQTNLTPENSQGVASASSLHGFKSEINSSIGIASMNAYRASLGSNQVASTVETLQEYLEDDMGEIYEDIQSKQDELSDKMDDLI